MAHDIDNPPKTINVGRYKEQNVANIAFDCSKWIERWPDGEFFATYAPPCSNKASLLSEDSLFLGGDIQFITITEEMTFRAGRGTLNIRLLDEGINKSSPQIGIYVDPSHAVERV